MKIGEGKLLVGAVCVIVVATPAEQQNVRTEVFGELPDDRDRPAFANENGWTAETGFNRKSDQECTTSRQNRI